MRGGRGRPAEHNHVCLVRKHEREEEEEEGRREEGRDLPGLI